jgi:YfiH family protein
MSPTRHRNANDGVKPERHEQAPAPAGVMSTLHGKAPGVTSRIGRQSLERTEAEAFSRKAAKPQVAPKGAVWLPVPGWKKKSWLWSGFSTRKGGESRAYCAKHAPGELNLGFTTTDDHETVRRNRRSITAAITGEEATPLVTVHQIHSGLVVVVCAQDATLSQPHKADGLITNEPGILLGIQTADCIPVLVADRKRRVVGAFHAGWRGTVKRIVETGVGRMRMEFGSQPDDLVAAIGPGIGSCCYSVGEEVLSEFESQFLYTHELFHEIEASDLLHNPWLLTAPRAPRHTPVEPKLHLDLVEANRRQLLDAGLSADAIEIVGGCTSCQTELFFSHRAEQGHTGRMLAVIGIKPR